MANLGIVELSQAGKNGGGKASSLATLLRAGFKVPAGFVVYPEAKLDDIEDWFDKLGATSVAVRSSALAEDGQKDAWAGQFDTYLNVTKKDLNAKIKACRDSAKNDRAKAYAKEKGLTSGGVSVIVQAMVPAEISGVAFSAHPVTQNKDQLVIEAVHGLADALVSGEVTPDTYVINKSDTRIIEQHLSGQKPILPQQQLTKLAKKVSEIEKLYGFAVDVEWSIAAGQLYILQARPITTLG